MVHVIATIHLKAGSRSEFAELFKANVPAVLAEDGCLEYSPVIDFASGLDRQACDENVLMVVEKWETLEALKKHLEMPHMNTFREQAGHLIESLDLKVMAAA